MDNSEKKNWFQTLPGVRLTASEISAQGWFEPVGRCWISDSVTLGENVVQ